MAGVFWIPADLADVVELAAALVVEQDVRRAGQAAGPAHHGRALPHAARLRARARGSWRDRSGRSRDEQVELAVAIVVDEGAARAPLLAAARGAALLGDFAERAVALIVEEPVLAVAGDVEIVEAVVVVVADARALAPAG